MTLRWRYGANAWEAMYYAGGGLSFGMGLNAQFIALSAAAPKELQGAAIGLYYLSQQVGMIFGMGSFSALQETVFRNALGSTLRKFPSRDEVGLAAAREPVYSPFFLGKLHILNNTDTDEKLDRL